MRAGCPPLPGDAQVPLSFRMHATFLYEQQVQREHETVLRWLQTLHMQVGMTGHLSLIEPYGLLAFLTSGAS